MLLFALTIFASAFLLFLVQPIIAKQILPWFGGSAAVWTTCLVLFHVALLAASVLVLPIIPAAAWKPLGTEDPVALILGLLAVTIGLPYFLLATTSPLLQAWFAERYS